MRMGIIYVGMISACVALLAFSIPVKDKGNVEAYELTLPAGFPQPLFPAGNELTQARVELGRMLFYDPVLSLDSSLSCASCHHQSLGFADNKSISPGVNGELAARNAPTLTNVAYNPTLLFDGFLTTLEMQILVPIQEHAEFNFNIVEIGKRLKKNPDYVKRSWEAYERLPDPYVITRAISSFERILISGNSRYDQYVNGSKKGLNRAEKRGMKLFFEDLYCAKCHGGFNFTNFETHNNGLYEVYADSGRMRATKLPEDRAVFKVPTLRNIELTAPYMHDGSIATLEAVVEHYMSGGKNHPSKSEFIQPFNLTQRQQRDLIAFLRSLTDVSFISNPAFFDPFIKN